MMKHKHAEIIKAWADGAKVQALSDNGNRWNDCNSAPNWNPFREYRIKPDHKDDFSLYFFTHYEFDIHESIHHFHQSTIKSEHKNLKLTFDGETGKLKSAEVLK